jgi:hypothetical protein
VQRSLPVADLEALVLRLSALTTRRDGFSRTAAATLTRLAGSGPTRLTEQRSAGRPRIAAAAPALTRLADALRRSSTPAEVTR